MSAPQEINVLSAEGDDLARTVELPAEVFDVQVNIPLIHQVVVAQLAAARQGTHDTKTRGEVRGGGRKPYRQKGTGRARQGSTRAPQFTGGGVVHGPTPRNYEQRTPKKMKAAALRGALSDRARGGRVHVVSGFGLDDEPSTKTAAKALARIADSRHVLLVLVREDEITWKSVRNLEQVHVVAPDQLNTYDVLVSDDVVFTERALDAFLRRTPDAAKEKDTVSDKPATDAGTTKPAGAGVSDEEAAKEVAEQTSSDLKAEDVFERESESASTDTEAAEATGDEVKE
jgi:large subunit ribosomal protein L4